MKPEKRQQQQQQQQKKHQMQYNCSSLPVEMQLGYLSSNEDFSHKRSFPISFCRAAHFSTTTQ